MPMEIDQRDIKTWDAFCQTSTYRKIQQRHAQAGAKDAWEMYKAMNPSVRKAGRSEMGAYKLWIAAEQETLDQHIEMSAAWVEFRRAHVGR